MWTNKQVWEFEQINEDLTFDMIYVEPGKYDEIYGNQSHPIWIQMSEMLQLEHLTIY